MASVLIGIDDTDNDTSPGTGKLARWLAVEIEQQGGQLRGITRHQFLLDDRIAYSTHNSGACIALEWTGPLSGLDFAFERITEWSAPGSDPGMCIVSREHVPLAVTDWGWAATREVLTTDGALNLARVHGLCLRALGGNGEGVIGALASVGLRADGNEGRFLDLPGLRALDEVVTLADLAALGIQVDHRMPGGQAACSTSNSPPDGTHYKTMNWVRPRLVQGQPVWPVEWSDDDHAWIPVDRKKTRPLE